MNEGVREQNGASYSEQPVGGEQCKECERAYSIRNLEFVQAFPKLQYQIRLPYSLDQEIEPGFRYR